MRFIKPVLTALAFTTAVAGADAIIAKRDVMTVTRPDGTTLRIKKTGDEAMHFTTTEDGILLHEANGVFTYARLTDDGIVESTGITAHNLDMRTAGEVNGATLLDNIDMDRIAKMRNVDLRRAQSYIPYGRIIPEGMQRAPQTGLGLVKSTFPTKGSTKGLIILVEYKDVKFTTEDPKRFFNDMINKKGFNEYGGTGSALDFFTEQSGGQFTPKFDVYGPVTLNGNRAAYGGNDSNGSDKNPAGMVAQAVKALDATVDFSQYDTDNDGEIDNVYVFYAGQGEASYGPDESVWPHSWDVRSGGYTVTVDGKRLGHYACSNEWESSRPDGVGTFIHEFSHVMGLPDLYSTGSSTLTCTPGAYSCMDYGPYNNDGCTPPNYSAYELNALGWFEPITLSGAESLSLDPITSGRFALIPTESNNEFFLIENRQQTGWDTFIPGHGMLIWHIDYVANVFSQNIPNNDSSHQYVDIVEANSQPNNMSVAAMEGWPFPGSQNKTEFTSTTKPALKSWAGKAINLPITNIEESEDGIISFDVDGGGVRIQTPVPVADTPGAADRFFEISWPAVEGATDYIVSVYAASKDKGGSITVDFADQKIPEGWAASLEKYYITTASSGENPPSFRLDADGNTLTSPMLPSDVNSLSFYIVGNGASMTSKLWLDFNINGTFTPANYIQLSGNTFKGTAVLEGEQIPAGARQLRFRIEKVKGNVALDDIVIKYGQLDQVLPDYNAVHTGGATHLRVDRLKDNHDLYYFTVAAINDRQRSSNSEPVYVTVSGMLGVEDIAVDNANEPARYFNLQGIEVANPTPGNLYIEKRGNTVRKVIIR